MVEVEAQVDEGVAGCCNVLACQTRDGAPKLAIEALVVQTIA